MSASERELVRARSTEALIAGVHPDGGDFARTVRTSADRIDWQWLLERAAAHNIAALLAVRLESSGLAPHLDASLQARLRDQQATTSACVRTTTETLRAVAARLGEDGIPFFVIKGSVLAETVYGDPLLRPFEDVDVVVPRGKVSRADQAIRNLGYRLGQVHKLLGTKPAAGLATEMAEAVTRRFYERFHYELPLIPTHRDWAPVDLHWHVAPASRLQVNEEQLWRETRRVTVAGTQVLTLTPEATLLHLAVHATTCSLRGFKLLPLCDIAWVMSRWELDPLRLWELADAWGVRSTLWSALELVERALGATVPEQLRARRPRFVLRPGFSVVARPRFLLHYRSNATVPPVRRAMAEVLWNSSMRCLGYNLERNLRTHLTRLRWKALCWRARLAARIGGARR